MEVKKRKYCSKKTKLEIKFDILESYKNRIYNLGSKVSKLEKQVLDLTSKFEKHFKRPEVSLAKILSDSIKYKSEGEKLVKKFYDHDYLYEIEQMRKESEKIARLCDYYKQKIENTKHSDYET